MSVYWSAPNQQVVREDQSGPGLPPDNPDYPLTRADELDEMTKAELLSLGKELGADVNQQMSKADIRAAVDEAEAEVTEEDTEAEEE